MAVREIAVFGLGRMGSSIAETFSQRGGHVIAIDKNQKNVDEISDKVAYAIRADVSDVDTIKNLGITNVDAAVVAMSQNLEASIIAIIVCKEMNIPYVIAKAQNQLQADILTKVGADKIIFPEVQMGERVALSLMYGNFVDALTLSDEFSIIETSVPKKWVGKTLIELDVRKKYGFNVIATRTDGKLSIDVKADAPLNEGQEIIVLGNDSELTKVFKIK